MKDTPHLPVPILLPDGVTFDGVWHSVNPTYLFTDRAVTESTFGIREHQLTQAKFDEELRDMRAAFEAAKDCACDRGHGVGIAPHICGCGQAVRIGPRHKAAIEGMHNQLHQALA